jgi:hypothetical protein
MKYPPTDMKNNKMKAQKIMAIIKVWEGIENTSN